MKFKISDKPVSQIDVDDYFVPISSDPANIDSGYGVYLVTGVSKYKIRDMVMTTVQWKNVLVPHSVGSGFDISGITSLVEACITPRYARYKNGETIVSSDKCCDINALGLRMLKSGERGVNFQIQPLGSRTWTCINSVCGTSGDCAKSWSKTLRAMADEIDHFEDME